MGFMKKLLILFALLNVACASGPERQARIATKNTLHELKQTCATSYEKTDISDGCAIFYCADFVSIQNETMINRRGYVVCNSKIAQPYSDYISIDKSMQIEQTEDMLDMSKINAGINAAGVIQSNKPIKANCHTNCFGGSCNTVCN